MTEQHDPSAYGSHVAADYDDLHADLDPTPAAETLAEMAHGGAVLELGIGTGRLALPLLDRGLEVAGIEASPEMAAVLARKPRGDRIPVTLGDFATADAGRRDFSLVALVFNTLYALPSQDAQVALFRNAARHLRDGGLFVVEAWLPDLGAFRDGRAVRPLDVGDGTVLLEVAEIFPAQQRMRTNKILLRGDNGVRVWPAHHRYAWPAELDLMARLAGMSLRHRWADWRRTAFLDASRGHVSVWQKAPDHG